MKNIKVQTLITGSYSLTDEYGPAADFIEKSNPILHGVLVGSNTKEESKHEESEEEELAESHR